MTQYYNEEYLIEECKNYLYKLFKNNFYLNDMWFIFLDYYEININATKYKALPIIIIFIFEPAFFRRLAHTTRYEH